MTTRTNCKIHRPTPKINRLIIDHNFYYNNEHKLTKNLTLSAP